MGQGIDVEIAGEKIFGEEQNIEEARIERAGRSAQTGGDLRPQRSLLVGSYAK